MRKLQVGVTELIDFVAFFLSFFFPFQNGFTKK